MTMMIRELPETEQPSYRLQHVGPQALSNAELLSILLQAADLEGCAALAKLADQAGGFSRLTDADICSIPGFKSWTANRVKVVVELARREMQSKLPERVVIHMPANVYDLVGWEMSRLDHEELWVLVLDTRNKVLEVDRLYKGTANSSTLRVGEFFKRAIHRNAASIVLVHNHPSGDPSPSPEDTNVTRCARQAGETLDIQVLDHIIIGDGRWVSMKEKGLGFSL